MLFEGDHKDCIFSIHKSLTENKMLFRHNTGRLAQLVKITVRLAVNDFLVDVVRKVGQALLQ